MEIEKNRNIMTKILAVAGTLLAWLPIAFTVLTSAVGTIATGRFRFDYLMPAELALIAFAGAALLIWAAKRAETRLKMIGFSAILAVFFFASVIVIPSVTGMASGRTEAAGAPFVTTILMLVLYSVSLIGIGVGGIQLCRDLQKKSPGGS